MDHPHSDTLSKERKALSVLTLLARLVPIVIKAWAKKEVERKGGRHLFPRLLAFLQEAGWNPQRPDGTDRVIHPN